MVDTERMRRTWRWYRLRAKVAWLNFCDRIQRRPVTGAHPVVVSITTHGPRLATVHTCIQSIVAGSIRPARLILWLNGNTKTTALPMPLQRLQQRGLEIRYAPNYGPHTKYFPYVTQFAGDPLPLVTADDDGMYANDWLEGLLSAHQSAPNQIHCHWARRFAVQNGRAMPYLTWKTVRSRTASNRHFALGVSGVIYPPAFLRTLYEAGDGFKDSCPKADDIWLHAMAVRAGYQVSQIDDQHTCPQPVPFTQDIALFQSSFLAAGNDAQIRATYTRTDLDALALNP